MQTGPAISNSYPAISLSLELVLLSTGCNTMVKTIQSEPHRAAISHLQSQNKLPHPLYLTMNYPPPPPKPLRDLHRDWEPPLVTRRL